MQQAISTVQSSRELDIQYKYDQAIRLENINGVSLDEYLKAFEQIINADAIRYISYINSDVCIFMDSKQSAESLLRKRVTINKKSLIIHPLITECVRVILSGVLPVIPNEVIENKIDGFDIAYRTTLKPLKIATAKKCFEHVFSSNSEIYIYENDVKRIPKKFYVEFEGFRYLIKTFTPEPNEVMVYSGSALMRDYKGNPLPTKRSHQSLMQSRVIVESVTENKKSKPVETGSSGQELRRYESGTNSESEST